MLKHERYYKELDRESIKKRYGQTYAGVRAWIDDNLANDEVAHGITNFRNILTNQATVEGFIVSRFASDFPQAYSFLERLYTDGKLKTKEDIIINLENTPEALLRVLTGKNFGKQIVQIV